MNKFLKEFKDRGFFYQCTSENELSKLLDRETINGYIGFDCTAESLTCRKLAPNNVFKIVTKTWPSTNSFIRWWHYKNW